MNAAYLLFFISFTLLAQSKIEIKPVPSPQTLEDFDHEFKGCPENSQCDQVMGHQIQRWKDLLSRLKNESMSEQKKAQFLELFRSKYGIPIEFYTTEKSQQGFKPLYFHSPCKNHNPKDKEKKVLKGIAFLQSLSNSTATVWRDQTKIQVPVGELISPQPVIAYFKDGPQKFHLPLNDQPLYFKNKELYTLREDDDLFFMLRVSTGGDWRIEPLVPTRLGEWEEKRQIVKCPVDTENSKEEIFGMHFCKTIWVEDTRESIVVKMHQGCIM